jgi:hypothetical protein
MSFSQTLGRKPPNRPVVFLELSWSGVHRIVGKAANHLLTLLGVLTTPSPLVAKLCTGSAESCGLQWSFCRRRCITMETVSGCTSARE